VTACIEGQCSTPNLGPQRLARQERSLVIFGKKALNYAWPAESQATRPKKTTLSQRVDSSELDRILQNIDQLTTRQISA
jgi:hypothetical protein